VEVQQVVVHANQDMVGVQQELMPVVVGHQPIQLAALQDMHGQDFWLHHQQLMIVQQMLVAIIVQLDGASS